MTKAPKSHIPALDGLRAIAFLLVFVAHDGFGRAVPGGFGVTIFFFLSGYLITTLLRMEMERTRTISFRGFYLRRARRILPPMYVSLAVGAALGAIGVATSAGSWLGVTSVVFYFFNYLLLLHSPFLMPSGSGVMWSLMIEEHFYFLFPPLYAVLCRHHWKRSQQGYLLVMLCVVALVWRYVLVLYFHTRITGNLPIWTYLATDARYDAILWGCILAIVNNPFGPEIDRPDTFLHRHQRALAIGGVLLILGTLTLRNPVFRETLRYSLQSIALYPIFFYLIHVPENLVTRILEMSVLRKLGAFSYAMYLSHTLILDVTHRFVTDGRVLGGIFAYVVAVFCAYLMQRFVENPMRRAIR